MAKPLHNRLSVVPAPAFKVKVAGPAKVKALYDRCHLAWRAGIIQDWYYGRRSPNDPTIVWEMNGRELTPGAIVHELDRVMCERGIDDVAWGEWWCGFRSVTITYVTGRRVSERYDARRGKVETVVA